MAEMGLPRGALLAVDRSRKPSFNQFALIRHEWRFLCAFRHINILISQSTRLNAVHYQAEVSADKCFCGLNAHLPLGGWVMRHCLQNAKNGFIGAFIVLIVKRYGNRFLRCSMGFYKYPRGFLFGVWLYKKW
jgi:hypothetical protein